MILRLIDTMQAAGCTDAQIIAAIKHAEAERLAKQRARTARCRARKKASGSNVTNVTPLILHKTGNGCNVTSVTEKEGGFPPPTPPLSPEEKYPPQSPSGTFPPKPSPRGSRLPSDWTLPDDWLIWAVDHGIPAERAAWEADKFADFWHGKTGQNACKRDWQATWRNWIRRVIDDGGQRAQTADDRRAEIRREMLAGLREVEELEAERLSASRAGP